MRLSLTRICSVFLLFMVVCFVGALFAQSTETDVRVSSSAPNDKPDELCGPRSLLVVATLFGKEETLESFVDLCKSDEKGISLYHVAEAAKASGWTVKARRLKTRDFKSISDPVIVHVDGNHFLVVEGVYGGLFRLIDHDINTPVIQTEAEFKKRFSGAALIIQRPKRAKGDPVLKMKSVIYDIGTVPRGVRVQHDFELTNQGKDILEIESVKTTCGCLVIAPTDREISRGETAAVHAAMTVEQQLREEFQTRTVVLRTADPAHPVTLLTLIARLDGRVGIKPVRLFVGDVRSSEVVTRTVSLLRTPDYPFKIARFHGTSEAIRIIPASDTDDKIEYQVELRPASLSAGEFKEEAIFSLKPTNTDRLLEVAIPIEGRVLSNLMFHPQRFFFGFVNSKEKGSCAIQLTNYSEQDVDHVNVTTETPGLTFRVTPIEAGRRYRVAATLDPDGLPAGALKGSVTITSNIPGSETLRVPIYALIQ